MNEDIVTVQQNGSAAFRPHAYLIRLLGDELISDEVMAVVELVKNGYDADASHISITLNNITHSDDGSIYIKDNGSGMDLNTLVNVWMQPATPHKRKANGNKVRTLRGRVQSGEKGVGRFAADKLGSELTLITRIAGAEKELVLQVNWHDFDKNEYLDDVECNWYFQDPIDFKDSHGTLLIIRSLRASWNQAMVTRLANGLSRLISPVSPVSDFTIELVCPEFSSVNGQVVNHLADTAPYKISGYVDRDGILQIQDNTTSSIDLRTLCHNHFISSLGALRNPLCGPFRISLNVWDLELQLGKGFGVDRVLREVIKSSSGVSIYRDGFRIWPYGEKDDDWLELNQRRVNNPTLRISNNQIIGFIEINHADNQDLKDRTSREGLIDTPAFFDLKALVLAALSEVETERFQKRHPVISPQPVVHDDTDEFLKYIAKIKVHQPANSILATKEIERLYKHQLQQLQDRYNHVASLAGIGMAAELLTDAFSREVNNSLTILHILQGETNSSDPYINQLVDSLSKHMAVINEQIDMMEPLYRPKPQNIEQLDVKGVVYDVISTLRHKLAETNTNVALNGKKNLSVRINRGHLMLAIMIIIDNALMIMKESSTEDPYIDIRIISEEDFDGLVITDSGPGISESHRKLIFEPAFSMRKSGRGMGLHIARDILMMYNSSLNLSSRPSPLPGACFEIRFDKRRVVNIHKNTLASN